MHAGDHLIPFAGKKKNTLFSVLVMVMLFLSNKGIVVNAAVPSESTMFSTDLLESQYCNMDNLYSLKKSCHTNVYSFAQLISYCKFSDICNRDEKPYCISTSHFGAYVCLKKNISCTKGRYYKALADANSPKKIFFEEDNCPDGTYQPDESNCIHACGNKHRNLKNISEKYIVFSVGNSSQPTLVICNSKLGYFNAKGILLLNYDENISDNICQQDGNVSSCPRQQYHLPNGTCVDKCDAGFERQLPDFVCTEIEKAKTSIQRLTTEIYLKTRKDSGYQKVPDQGTNKDAADQKVPDQGTNKDAADQKVPYIDDTEKNYTVVTLSGEFIVLIIALCLVTVCIVVGLIVWMVRKGKFSRVIHANVDRRRKYEYNAETITFQNGADVPLTQNTSA